MAASSKSGSGSKGSSASDTENSDGAPEEAKVTKASSEPDASETDVSGDQKTTELDADMDASELDADLTDVADHDQEESGGSSFAATALKFLIFVLVIFGLSLWLVPMVAPHLPAGVARHLMPGQQEVNDRLAAMSTEVKAETAKAATEVEALRAEIAALTERLQSAEGEVSAAQRDVVSAQAVATDARDAAMESAEAAAVAATSGEAADQAEAAAKQAAGIAETATSAATEAGKVAAAATRDAAALSRRLTSFEAQLTAMASEIDAVRESLAGAVTGEASASPEMAAAFATMKARVDTMSAQLSDSSDYITLDDANRFATQDDLRSARTALDAEFRAALGALPPPETVATSADVAALGQTVDEKVSELSGRIDTVKDTAMTAAESATAAQAAAEETAGRVGSAIRGAKLSSAVATLESQVQNGVPFAGALAEIVEVSGVAAPEPLAAAAQSGLVTPRDLVSGFGTPRRSAVEASIVAEADDDAISRATARFRSIVEGRPKGEQAGDDAGSVLSRIEARLLENDPKAALEEADTLTGAAREALGDWYDKLKARVAADMALSAYLSEVRGSQG